MSYRREPREMHKAVCDDCGEECEVPFKPDPSRPVYCRETVGQREDRQEGPDTETLNQLVSKPVILFQTLFKIFNHGQMFV